MILHPNESVFKSALRSFFKVFGAAAGFLVAFVLIALALSLGEEKIKKPEKGQFILAADAEGKREVLAETAPVVLKLKIHGVIGEEKLTTEQIENLLFDVEESHIKLSRIKGLLLDVNTPGGLATDSAGIYQVLKMFKAKHNIPIYAFVDGICASGGMYIAAVADQIYATSASLIGSVGSLMGPFFNVAQGMDKIGIQALTLTDGKGKDFLNPFRAWKEGEDASLQEIVKEDYAHFVHHIISTRPRLDKEKLVNEYGAMVFAPSKAKEYGFIDVAGATYFQTLAELTKAAGIEANTKVQVLEIKSKEGLVRELLSAHNPLLKGKVIHTLETGSVLKPSMSGKLLYLFIAQ